MANTNTGISNFIYSQTPFFVRNDHPTFVKFLEAYYEYMEQEGKVINRAKDFRNALNIDETIDLYSDKLYSQFLQSIPKDIIADKNLILKHIKDFYKARGTEKSVEFLMSILYNLDVDFYYPKKDVLKASDGKWFIEKSLKVYDLRLNDQPINDDFAVKKFAGREIQGLKSNAAAIVETADIYYENGVLVKELKISNLIRDFEIGEGIYTTYEDEGETKTLKANVFSGIIVKVDLTNRGNNYIVGQEAKIESNTGAGGTVIVSSVSRGTVKGVSIVDGGAGFQNLNQILVSGGGSGANLQISLVNTDESVHPNTYNIVISLIDAEANTQIGNLKYSNLNSSISNPANAWIQNSMSYFTYANTGPISRVIINDPGNDYTSLVMTAEANTRVRALGILGKMKIINPGTGYAVNDVIQIINQKGILKGAGTGAQGYVSSVNGTGAITGVKFKAVQGNYVGGSGYDMNYLPTTNIVSTGVGANVVVTAVLGDGENIVGASDEIGAILSLKIISGGSGYKTPPTINLKHIGSGTAQATATIVGGVYTYPGRYLNDDGHLSGFNFLQDGKYYHNYSYVVRIKQAINNYRKALKDLIHPAGMSLFGEYLTVDDSDTLNVSVAAANVTNTRTTTKNIFIPYANLATYNVRTLAAPYSNVVGSNTLVFTSNYHGIAAGSNAYVRFVDGNMANTPNALYVISSATTNTLTIPIQNVATSSGNAVFFFGNVSINLANHGLSTNDAIYVSFVTGDTANLSNATYTANKISNNIFTINTSGIGTANGTANVWLNTMRIVRTAHGFTVGQNLYFENEGTNTPNIVNGTLVVTGVNNVNSFNVVHTGITTTYGYLSGNAAIWLLS